MPTIEQKAARGAAWTIGFGLASRLLGVISTLLLTYYILPDDYGAVILANVVAVTTAVFSSCGLTQYIVVQKELKRDEAFHVSFFYLLITTLALTSVVVFQTPLLAWLEIPSAAPYLPYMCLAFWLDRIAMLPERQLSRKFEFRAIALTRAATETTYALIALGCAVAGLQGMSIVYANIARFALMAILFLRLVPFSEFLTPVPLRWGTTRRIFAFGLPLSLDGLSHFASRQWDNLLMGRFFGEKTAGVYNLAYNLADIPATHVGEHIGDVLLPSFAQLEGERRRRALQKSTGILSMIVFPMACGLAVVAPTVTTTILKPEWKSVGPMLTLLAGLSIVRPVGWTMISYLQSLKFTRPIMVLGVLRLIMLMAALFLLKPLGPLWACLAAGLAYSTHAAGGLWMVSRRDDISMLSILRELLPAVFACCPMVFSVLAIRYLLADQFPFGWVQLATEILTGALVYVGAMRVISPVAFQNVVAQLKTIILRRRQQTEDTES